MATRAIHGSLWTAARLAAEYGLRMISSLILTRLLVPEAFGLMALISVLMTGFAMFSDMGISSSVVQSKRGDDPTYLNTAWTLQVIRGFVLWIFAALFADSMAIVYAQPELRVLILALGDVQGQGSGRCLASELRHRVPQREGVARPGGQAPHSVG